MIENDLLVKLLEHLEQFASIKELANAQLQKASLDFVKLHYDRSHQLLLFNLLAKIDNPQATMQVSVNEDLCISKNMNPSIKERFPKAKETLNPTSALGLCHSIAEHYKKAIHLYIACSNQLLQLRSILISANTGNQPQQQLDDMNLSQLFAQDADNDDVKPSASFKHLTYTSPVDQTPIDFTVVSDHSLWGNYLWNGAKWMCDHILLHPTEFQNRSILELGAGAGLPSILCAAYTKCASVVVTDYPDDALINNIKDNINRICAKSDCINAMPFLWGDATQIRDIQNITPKFDVIFLCDVIFNHSEHVKMLSSCEQLIDQTSDDAVVWCVFTHYRPWLMAKDLAFFDLATSRGWVVEHLLDKIYPDLLFPKDAMDPRVTDPTVMRTVHVYRLTRSIV